MKGLFITGTDTGVGKTVVTGLFARWLMDRGYRVVSQKWIQTGPANDIVEHIRIMGVGDRLNGYMESMVPYRFSFPSSPHLASSIEGIRIDQERIKRHFFSLSEAFDLVLVEGTGGVLVPIDQDTLLIDMVNEIGLPVLVVAINRLGAINHTLLTIEALRRRGIRIIGVIFNNLLPNEERLILEDNPRIVEKISKVPVLGTIGYGDDELLERFSGIGEEILKRWRNG